MHCFKKKKKKKKERQTPSSKISYWRQYQAIIKSFCVKMFHEETYSELFNNAEDRIASLSEAALVAFPTFESNTRDWRILAGGVLKCYSQENIGQNIVRSGIHDTVSTGNIVTEDIYWSKLEPATIRPVVYLIVCFSCGVTRLFIVPLTFWIFKETLFFFTFLKTKLSINFI